MWNKSYEERLADLDMLPMGKQCHGKLSIFLQLPFSCACKVTSKTAGKSKTMRKKRIQRIRMSCMLCEKYRASGG